jgi:hypothetical protein
MAFWTSISSFLHEKSGLVMAFRDVSVVALTMWLYLSVEGLLPYIGIDPQRP